MLRNVLDTKEAKEAIGEGLIMAIKNGNLDDGIDAMIARGTKNGSWPAAKLAFVMDFLGVSEE